MDCKVGYLSKHLAVWANAYDGVCAYVVEICSAQSEVAAKRHRFHCNKGCCVAEIIDSHSVLGLNDAVGSSVGNNVVVGEVRDV